MRKFSKPIIIVSRCIEFDAVRYDGAKIKSDLVAAMKKYVNFIPICPEVEIGLPIPRDSLRIVKNASGLFLKQPASGKDLTLEIELWANNFLDNLPDIDGFLMKSKSPSSGLFDAKIYPSIEKSASLGRGPGFFGAEVIRKFNHLAVEDEKRLLHPRIRDHFLKKIFTLADFRELKKKGNYDSLVDFQAENKLLFTAYNQKELRIMGKIVAERRIKKENVFTEYESHLWKALSRVPRPGSNINIALKSFGYFSKNLNSNEKKFFMDVIEDYKIGKIPFSAVSTLLRGWFTRFQEEYLLKQTFFEPYPPELADIGIESFAYDERDLWKQVQDQ
ncbi:DUF1722 domain-containing protein [Candidatus Bathyarchaeota archaeon]|nr:DUF1722 domain-containing protein [Candidatus Bathyarchaeota archaeon]